MRRLAFALFFLSGALALLYEVVWLRLLVLMFGSTHLAVTSVLTAFMAGLALGAFVFGRSIDSSRFHPLVLYGFLEVGIGLLALAIGFLLDPSRPLALLIASADVGGLGRFLFPLGVLLVPTMLMGGTLPVLSRFVTRRAGEIGASVGLLYGINTFGAVLGTAVTGFFLIPAVGVSRTIAIGAFANVALAAVAFVAARRTGPFVAEAPSAVVADRSPMRRKARGQQPKRKPADDAAQPSPAALWATAGTGFLALVYEIAWTRVLVLILGSSVYAFTVMLSTFLAGLAAGASIGARFADRLRTHDRLLRALALTIAFAAMAGYATLRILPQLPWLFAWGFDQLGLVADDLANPGGRAVRLLFLEFVVAFIVMFPATLFMGMVFPLAIRLWVGRLDALGGGVGTVYAANSAGTILGAVLGGFVILPRAGLQGGILAAVAGGLFLAAALATSQRSWTWARRSTALVAAAICVVVLVSNPPPWDPMVMNSGTYQYAPDLGGTSMTAGDFALLVHEGGELLHYEEGMTAAVVVGRQPSTGNVWMSINGKIDASSNRDLETQLLLGHLPMLLNDAPTPAERQVVVIGYASGITTGAVTRHDPARVVAVEIEPAVLRASTFFDAVNHRPLSDPRVQAVEADGRSFLLADSGPYDVIISEPSSPWMTMAANLFTREFFEIGRRRLAPGGVFSQWLQLYGLTVDDLQSLMKTFTTVFPQVTIFWTTPGQDILLLGSEAPLQMDIGRLKSAMSNPEVARDLARIDIHEVEGLFPYYLMGDAEARAFVGDAPLNTDDNALIEFRAPLTMHAWKRTGDANTRALNALAVNPVSRASGLPVDAAAQAEWFQNLGSAFARKQMSRRAVDAVRRAQEVFPTAEGGQRLASYEAAAAEARESK